MRNTTSAGNRAAADPEILELLRSRDEDGLRALLLQYGGRVRSTLLGKFGPQRENDVEDAISEATYRVWNQIDGFDASKCGLGAWFYVIARNALITTLRAQAALPLTDVLSVEAPGSAVPQATGPATGGEVGGKERLLTDLDDCIQQLGEIQRDIVLSDLEAGSPVEAKVFAERWNTTPNSIWVSRNHAHASLRACLQHKGYSR